MEPLISINFLDFDSFFYRTFATSMKWALLCNYSVTWIWSTVLRFYSKSATLRSKSDATEISTFVTGNSNVSHFFYDKTRKEAWMKDNALRLLERPADALSFDARNHCKRGWELIYWLFLFFKLRPGQNSRAIIQLQRQTQSSTSPKANSRFKV